MDLQMDPSVAAGYTSLSQVARRVTGDWAAHNLFCPACEWDSLSQAPSDSTRLDFICPECSASFRLRGKSGPFGNVVPNSAYQQKIAAILRGESPHYAFLHYSRTDWTVRNLFLVPGFFFTPAIIQERPPLKPTAKRAGWVGSNILLGALPAEARVPVVVSGLVRDVAAVRDDWARFQFLQLHDPDLGGWGAAVLACVRTTVRETGSHYFSLQEFTARHASALAVQYPHNHHVEAKIRQQLQVLRDAGVLSFLGNGQYQVVG